MATRTAHYFETPEHHSGADYRARYSGYRHDSDPILIPKRRSRAGTILVAVLGGLVGFSAIMLAARSTDEPTLSATPMTPSREPSYSVNPAYEQSLLISSTQGLESASGDTGASTAAMSSDSAGDVSSMGDSSNRNDTTSEQLVGSGGPNPSTGSTPGVTGTSVSGMDEEGSTQRWINSARPGTDINQQPATTVDAADPMFPRMDDTASDVTPNGASPNENMSPDSPSSTTDDNPY